MHFVFTTLGYHPDITGGAFRYVTELAEGLARRSHRVEVIYPSGSDEGPRKTSENRNSVLLHRFRIKSASFAFNWLDRNNAARERLRIIRADDPGAAIVSCHGYFASAVSRSGGQIISLFTGPWAEEFLQSNTLAAHPFLRRKILAPALKKVERTGLEQSQAICTISRYYQENIPAWHPGLRKPIEVIEGGVNLSQFHPFPDRSKIRERYQAGPNDFVFLAVRRLEPRMGLHQLIDAFRPIAAEIPGARLWIGGDGSERDSLLERIKSFRLDDRVQMLGFIPEPQLPLRYAAADCTVMPSVDLEGFGLATVESLACGTPVLGSSRGATPEILNRLDSSLVYQSAADLTVKMRSVLKAPAILPTRAACWNFAEANYSWDRVVGAFERLCLRLPVSL